MSRLVSTERVLTALGARRGALFGRYSDRQAYELLSRREVAPLATIVEELACEIECDPSRTVAGDAMEGFNPVHDLCRLIVDLAVEAVERRSGTPVVNLQFDLEAHPDSGEPEPPGLRLVLDESALERKLAAASAYDELRFEVERALSRYGDPAFRVECLHRAPTERPIAARVEDPPSYEKVGEERVARGLYDHVLRFRSDFLPLAGELRRAVLGG